MMRLGPIEPCSAYEALVAEVLFGTPTEAERQRLAAHAAGCASCAAALQDLQGTLDVMAARQRPRPPSAYWDGYYDRLADRMAAEAAADAAGRGSLAPDRAAHHRFPRRYVYQAAAAVVLIAAGIVLGRLSGTEVPGPTPAADPPMTPVTPVALETRTQAYLDRSKVLLLGLVNFDTATEDPAGLDLPRQQEVAHALLQDAAYLQAELSRPDQEQLRQLMADLELILLQIANLEAGQDLPAIELIQRGIDRRGVLLKINLTEMHQADAPGLRPAAERRPVSESDRP